MSGVLGGPAQLVVTSTEAPDGGPARPVAVVTSPLYTSGGAPLKVVEVADNRPRIGGPAMPVVVASGQQASSPQAGPPIPVYVVSGSLASNMAYTNKVKALSPIAYWPLAESSGTVTTDESGNGRNGVYKAAGEPLLGQTGIGDGRTSALFDGTNDYADIFSASLAAAFVAGELTVQSWFKINAAGVWSDATDRRPLNLRADANNRLNMNKTATANQVACTYVAGGTSKGVNFTTAGPLTWVHLAMTVSKSADQLKFYVNGVQQGATQTGLGTWAGALASGVCVIGASDLVGSAEWSGNLAHVAVWGSALSAAQIATLAVVP